ncbi:MAG TPA: type II toxin-antitoxin system HicB family antitoxin [Candidatus Hypogeohydataceae bacterium YC41]
MKTKFKIILEKEKRGSYTVFVPALPGCHTQGDTIEEALKNAREAIECYIESLKKDGLPIPTVPEELVCDIEVKV